MSGQHGALSGKLSFWRGTRLNPDSINSVFEGNPKFLPYLVSFTVAISGLAEVRTVFLLLSIRASG